MPSPTPRPQGFAVGRRKHGGQTRHSVALAYSRDLAGVAGADAASSRPAPMAKRLRKNHDGARSTVVHTRTIDFEGGLKEGGEGALCMFAESGAEMVSVEGYRYD